MSDLKLAERAADSPMNGFTLRNAVFEALGGASVCWDEYGVLQSDRAVAIGNDLIEAFHKFVRIAINQESIDARLNIADFELADRIFSAPAIGGLAAFQVEEAR